MDALYVYVARALEHNCLILMSVAWMHKECSIQIAKCTISLKLGGRLAITYQIYARLDFRKKKICQVFL